MKRVIVSWNGTTAAYVDIYRGGIVIATTANSGSYNDNPSGNQSYTYKVCDVAGCSRSVTAQF